MSSVDPVVSFQKQLTNRYLNKQDASKWIQINGPEQKDPFVNLHSFAQALASLNTTVESLNTLDQLDDPQASEQRGNTISYEEFKILTQKPIKRELFNKLLADNQEEATIGTLFQFLFDNVGLIKTKGPNKGAINTKHWEKALENWVPKVVIEPLQDVPKEPIDTTKPNTGVAKDEAQEAVPSNKKIETQETEESEETEDPNSLNAQSRQSSIGVTQAFLYSNASAKPTKSTTLSYNFNLTTFEYLWNQAFNKKNPKLTPGLENISLGGGIRRTDKYSFFYSARYNKIFSSKNKDDKNQTQETPETEDDTASQQETLEIKKESKTKPETPTIENKTGPTATPNTSNDEDQKSKSKKKKVPFMLSTGLGLSSRDTFSGSLNGFVKGNYFAGTNYDFETKDISLQAGAFFPVFKGKGAVSGAIVANKNLKNGGPFTIATSFGGSAFLFQKSFPLSINANYGRVAGFDIVNVGLNKRL